MWFQLRRRFATLQKIKLKIKMLWILQRFGFHQTREEQKDYHKILLSLSQISIPDGYGESPVRSHRHQRNSLRSLPSPSSNSLFVILQFSDNFTIILFHYDGRTSEWDDEFEWSRKAIHVSVNKQTKWWYAKRFLHPDIVAPYEYIFIWDEDLGVEQFDAEEYITLVKKHGLEVSQPGLEPHKEVGITWQMTKQIKGNSEVHKETTERPGWCWDPHQPPCAAFVEIMAPVFSRNAWRCTWYMIQNDLVHGWGLDFALQRCIEPPAHEKIGVVDAQPIVHQGIPSLSGKNSENGKSKRLEVKQRSRREWQMFQERIGNAEKAYLKSIGV
ncbi:uncharacterized protein LOC116026647 isoform X4 [Ipomoea triloba]|uniref:uncharacterized protein LOC116026647 isoform X4 n=1 Tax=Ipomoea triloba TaxID=35885 RepID=UPI00125DF5CF|nr:uncharacterized protein LOC116026647 isoform X4 [Ipomoea triloba]